jgi:hypothetical protein
LINKQNGPESSGVGQSWAPLPEPHANYKPRSQPGAGIRRAQQQRHGWNQGDPATGKQSLKAPLGRCKRGYWPVAWPKNLGQMFSKRQSIA